MYQIETRLPQGQELGGRILVTGGAGFIGAHLVEHLLAQYPSAHVSVIDCLTYAGDLNRLTRSMRSGRVDFAYGCVTDAEFVSSAMCGIDMVFHLAAESHVSHSFLAPGLFDKSNRVGTAIVMQGALKAGVGLVVHVSTDEVYGTRFAPAAEDAPLTPSSPYSVSKAAHRAKRRRASSKSSPARTGSGSHIPAQAQWRSRRWRLTSGRTMK